MWLNAIVPSRQSILNRTAALPKGSDRGEVTIRNKDRKIYVVNGHEHELAQVKLLHQAGQPSKPCNASGGSRRTARGNSASPEANPKGCERNKHTDESGRITKSSAALQEHEKERIAISLLSRKANLWNQEGLEYVHAEKKSLILLMRGVSLK